MGSGGSHRIDPPWREAFTLKPANLPQNAETAEVVPHARDIRSELLRRTAAVQTYKEDRVRPARGNDIGNT
jgi:hypothetical protein